MGLDHNTTEIMKEIQQQKKFGNFFWKGEKKKG